MFRPKWPSSGVMICSGGNCCYFVATVYVVPLMHTCVVRAPACSSLPVLFLICIYHAPEVGSVVYIVNPFIGNTNTTVPQIVEAVSIVMRLVMFIVPLKATSFVYLRNPSN
jgi:hypothetical protein